MNIAKELTFERRVIDKDNKGEPSVQVGVLKNVLNLHGKDELYTVFQSSNYFGLPLTLGFKVSFIPVGEKEVSAEMCCKMALCSEDDTYDPDHGRDLVLGRLLTNKEYDFDVTGSKQLVYKSFGTYTQEKLKKLDFILCKRDLILSMQDLGWGIVKRNLKKTFSEFK